MVTYIRIFAAEYQNKLHLVKQKINMIFPPCIVEQSSLQTNFLMHVCFNALHIYTCLFIQSISCGDTNNLKNAPTLYLVIKGYNIAPKNLFIFISDMHRFLHYIIGFIRKYQFSFVNQFQPNLVCLF